MFYLKRGTIKWETDSMGEISEKKRSELANFHSIALSPFEVIYSALLTLWIIRKFEMGQIVNGIAVAIDTTPFTRKNKLKMSKVFIGEKSITIEGDVQAIIDYDEITVIEISASNFCKMPFTALKIGFSGKEIYLSALRFHIGQFVIVNRFRTHRVRDEIERRAKVQKPA